MDTKAKEVSASRDREDEEEVDDQDKEEEDDEKVNEEEEREGENGFPRCLRLSCKEAVMVTVFASILYNTIYPLQVVGRREPMDLCLLPYSYIALSSGEYEEHFKVTRNKKGQLNPCASNFSTVPMATLASLICTVGGFMLSTPVEQQPAGFFPTVLLGKDAEFGGT